MISPEQQVEFFLSLVKKDIEHYSDQEETVNSRIRMSILSLNRTETSYLEELRKEYKQKTMEQKSIHKELQKTLSIFQIMQREG
jgi:hypothetical protein